MYFGRNEFGCSFHKIINDEGKIFFDYYDSSATFMECPDELHATYRNETCSDNQLLQESFETSEKSFIAYINSKDYLKLLKEKKY